MGKVKKGESDWRWGDTARCLFTMRFVSTGNKVARNISKHGLDTPINQNEANCLIPELPWPALGDAAWKGLPSSAAQRWDLWLGHI